MLNEPVGLVSAQGRTGPRQPTELASPEYTASTKVTAPLAEQIVSQTHELPNDRTVRSLQQETRKEKSTTLV